ncbi:MAG: hypothetical protein GY810_03585, partial [Aureispira sp.]|nr:hypothetical protein [Aureispira sp.]
NSVNTPFTTRKVYEYNKKRDLLNWSSYEFDGEIGMQEIYDYNSNGQLVEKATLLFGEISARSTINYYQNLAKKDSTVYLYRDGDLLSTEIFKYDKSNNLIRYSNSNESYESLEEREYKDGVLAKVRMTKDGVLVKKLYNNYGYLERKEYYKLDSTLISEYVYEYKWDENLNWVESKRFKDDSLYVSIIRKIKYY